MAPDVPPGPLSVTVTAGGITSPAITATASLYVPAFFVWPGNQPVATRPDYTYAVKAGTFTGVSTLAAKPGGVTVLWGTGFGSVNPPAPAGLVVPAGTGYATITLPTVTIDSVAATVSARHRRAEQQAGPYKQRSTISVSRWSSANRPPLVQHPR